MRRLLLGILCGLVAGIPAALAYEHYLGDGAQLAQIQAQLNAANAALSQSAEDSRKLKSQSETLTSEVQQLSSANDNLEHQLDALKETSAASVSGSTTPSGNADSSPIDAMMKTAMAQQYQQKMLLLKTRLHLTPEQEAAVQAAMDAESKGVESMSEKVFAGGKITAQSITTSPVAKSVEKTLDDILTPDQKTIYQQMQTDEKSSAVDTITSVEMNQIAPYVQLSEAQKDQVYSALYQVQTNAMDPNWIQKNAGDGTDPLAILNAQAKAKDDALAKILSPDQMTAYRQQAQSQLDMQKAMMQKFSAGNATSDVSVRVVPAP